MDEVVEISPSRPQSGAISASGREKTEDLTHQSHSFVMKPRIGSYEYKNLKSVDIKVNRG